MYDHEKSDSESIEQGSQEKIYHEKQSKQLCALHALNNLFQHPGAFTKQDLDTICNELSPDSRIFNPHRSSIGLGCYDVNVIITALDRKNYEVIWFDKRKELCRSNLDKVYGFILNIPNEPTNGLFAVPLSYIPARARIWSSQKHWITVRRIGNVYFELDSNLNQPIEIGDENSLLQYLSAKSQIELVEILIIVPKHIVQSGSWIKT